MSLLVFLLELNLVVVEYLVMLQEGNLNVDKYIRECLEPHVFPYMLFVEDNFPLLQDNYHLSIARRTEQFLNDIGIQVHDYHM